jgi:predicted SnoaL-like aldol condensation-catalyzing enzyme
LPAGRLGIFEAGSQAYHLAMSDLEHNKQVVARFMDEVSDHGDIDLLDELCASDVVNHAARPGLRDGLDALKTLMRGIHQSQVDRHWTDQRFVAEGDWVVVYGVRKGNWRATSFRGVTTPEGEISTELAHLFRLREGLIAEHWAVRDDLGMMQQLGVLPSPEEAQ